MSILYDIHALMLSQAVVTVFSVAAETDHKTVSVLNRIC